MSHCDLENFSGKFALLLSSSFSFFSILWTYYEKILDLLNWLSFLSHFFTLVFGHAFGEIFLIFIFQSSYWLLKSHIPKNHFTLQLLIFHSAMFLFSRCNIFSDCSEDIKDDSFEDNLIKLHFFFSILASFHMGSFFHMFHKIIFPLVFHSETQNQIRSCVV